MANGWGPPNYICCGCLDVGRIPKWKEVDGDDDHKELQRTGWKKCDDIIHDDANNKLHGKERRE